MEGRWNDIKFFSSQDTSVPLRYFKCSSHYFAVSNSVHLVVYSCKHEQNTFIIS